MHLQMDHMGDLARALERQVELQAEAAKRAIREYEKSILEVPTRDSVARIERQRAIENVVKKYIQLQKRLDEVRTEMSTSSTREATGDRR